MKNYTIHCTEEQAKKALELGAPIEFEMECHVNLETLERSPYPDIKMGKDGEPILIIPTAEQMISWLEDNKCYIDIDISSLNDITWEYFVYNNYHDIINEEYIEYHSRQEAILAAIDVALDYLINKK